MYIATLNYPMNIIIRSLTEYKNGTGTLDRALGTGMKERQWSVLVEFFAAQILIHNRLPFMLEV